MQTEIITIGDEILIGQIVDTNSAWIGQQIVEAGGEVRYITTIADKKEEIKHALDIASKRSDIVLITGGLGPTKDDVTKVSMAEHFGVELVNYPNVLAHIEKLFARKGRPLNDGSRSQAMLPENCTPLQNDLGTAPGMQFDEGNVRFVSMPGVPYEMKAIMEAHVLPFVRSKNSKVLRHVTTISANVPESELMKRLSGFESELPAHIKLAYLPHMNLVRLRLTGRGDDEIALEAELTGQQRKLMEVLGDVAIATEDIKLGQILGQELLKRNATMSIAESCTGGFASHLITQNSGSSAYYPGSVVTYSYDIKTSVLGVPSELLWQQGAVSEDVVKHMANRVRRQMNTDFGLAISGIAGPGGATKDKPVGTVWIAVCSNNETVTKCYHLKGNRQQNIERSSLLGLELLRKLVVASDS